MSLLDAEETASRTGTQSYHGAIHDPRAGTIQPLAYCHGLARAAANSGASFYEQSPAVHIAHTDGDWVVTSPKGQVTAKSLLLATNAYHLGGSGIDAPKLIPVHYFQMATQPLSQAQLASILPGKEGCWDSAMVMSSFRTDAAGRLIIGGVGQMDHLASNIHRQWAQRKLAALYPALQGTPLENVWSGVIGMTTERIPQVISLGPNGYSVVGYSGRGIAPGTVFGTAVVNAIMANDESLLPLIPIERQQESFVRSKQCYYEFGATATHFLANRFN